MTLDLDRLTEQKQLNLWFAVFLKYEKNIYSSESKWSYDTVFSGDVSHVTVDNFFTLELYQIGAAVVACAQLCLLASIKFQSLR